MGTVQITDVAPDPEIYGTLAEHVAHIGASFGRPATRWRALSADDKARTLVEATRLLDALELEDDGAAIGHDTVIAAVIEACSEWAMLLAADASIKEAVDTGSNVKSLDGDGPKIEFFRPTSVATGTATRLPVAVQRLIGEYLPSADSVAGYGGTSYGTDGESSFDDCDDTKRSDPY